MTEDLLQELLDDPDRDTLCGAAPVVSYDPQQDEADFLEGIHERAVRKTRLIRRGSDHGHFALIDDDVPLPKKEVAIKRWRSARPTVLRGEFEEVTERAPAGDDLYERLTDASRLAPWVQEARLPEGMSLSGTTEPLDDPERDLAKLSFDDAAASEGRAWMKLTRLSNHPEDDSLRLRI